MEGKRHIDGILLFGAANVWYIYIQYMKALELDTETSSVICIKALQPMFNFGT